MKLLLLLLLIPFLNGCAAMVVGGAVGAAVVASDSRPVGTQVDDSGLRIRAQAALAEISELNGQRIQVQAYNSNVLLYGQVAESQQRDLAVRAVRDVNGVNTVYNQIRVTDVVTFVQRTRDSVLTSRVKTLLLADAEHDNSGIKVISENNEVFLLGIVDEKTARAAIEKVRNISGVERVIDVLEVR